MSATKSKSQGNSIPRAKSPLQSLQDFLASIRFAIILLTCIAAGSIIGTVIKQEGRPDEYLSLYSERVYRIITFLGLDDVYHSPWFLALLLLFAINLTLCTLRRLKPVLKGGREPSLPEEGAMEGMAMHFRVRSNVEDKDVASIFKGYGCTHSSEAGKVFQKGGLSGYGVLLIHASIMLILIGGFVGLIGGFRGFLVLQKGDTKNAITLGGERPYEKPLGFALKLREFEVTFYANGAPKDYVSTVEVIEDNRIVLEKQIRVNDPLSYKGIHVYQASYGKAPSFLFNMGGERVTLRERETYRKDNTVMMPIRFEENIHNFGPGVMVAYLDQDEPRTVWFLKNIDRFNERNIQGISVRLEDISEDFYTGLSVSKDPGIWIVWTGFAFILLGLYINFFIYHRRIYLRKTADGYIVAGVAVKNTDAFKEEFNKLRGKFDSISP